jgi:hypothetical protein
MFSPAIIFAGRIGAAAGIPSADGSTPRTTTPSTSPRVIEPAWQASMITHTSAPRSRNPVEGDPDLVIDNAVADGLGGLVIGAGVNRQHHLIQVAALGVLPLIDDRLLGTVAGEIDQHEITRTRVLGKLCERFQNGGAGRIAFARGKTRADGETIGEHSHVLAREAALLQHPPQQRSVVRRPFQFRDLLVAIVGDADEQRVVRGQGGGD